MNLILFGFKSCGKSYFGKLLSLKLCCPYYDTDKLLEEKFQKENNQSLNCFMIHKTYGSTYFRSLEAQVVQSLENIDGSIISLGGGAVLSKQSLNHLKKLGQLIYLNAPKDLLKSRLLNSKNFPSYLDPNQKVASFEKCYDKRLPIYKSIYDHEITLQGKDNHEVLKLLENLFYQRAQNGS